MKKYLLDPKKNYYKANLHCHSKNSDGRDTVEEIKEMYKKEGYSIVAFTDHELIVDNSFLSDDNFLALTGVEIAIKEDMFKSTLDATDMRVCHLNLISKTPHNTNTPCYNSIYNHFNKTSRVTKPDYNRIYSHEGISEIIKIANSEGFLVTYNHPRWSLENARDYLGYKGLWAVEIFNNSSFYNGLYEYNINVYDDFLRDGEKLACIMADDNHSKKTAFSGYTVINAERLEYSSVIQAMENHNLYCSNGPKIEELYIENNNAYLTFENGIYATASCGGRFAVKSQPLKENGCSTVKFNLDKMTKYYRFDVVDSHGLRANTCGYFI